MKTKIVIVWTISILLALLLGALLGTINGISAGKAMYHNENVRTLEIELADASRACTDLKVKGTVDAIRQVISTMPNQEKAITAGEIMNARLKELQNQVPEDTARKLADPQH